jgi:Abi-like protein
MLSLDEINILPKLISAPRFSTYLKHVDNDVARALDLYQRNIKISAAFVVLVQVCEVIIRNAVVEAIELVHGKNWYKSTGFIRSLPQPKKHNHYNPQDNLKKLSHRYSASGKIVAELNFAFWEKILTTGQDNRLWLPTQNFKRIFPGCPHDLEISKARGELYNSLMNIRLFRNRIAHQEPIFYRELKEDYDRLLKVIEWRSPVAAKWVEKFEQVNSILKEKP